MFRVLIYPKETIEDLISKGSLLGPLMIHSIFAILIWGAIKYGPDKSLDFTWYFMEALYGDVVLAVCGTLAIIILTVIALHILGRLFNGTGQYRDILIAYSYGLIPYYTGILLAALFPRFVLQLVAFYLIWTVYLTVRLISYAHDISIRKSIVLFLLSNSILIVFIYLPTIFLILVANYNSFGR
jgi:hypothetical protein